MLLNYFWCLVINIFRQIFWWITWESSLNSLLQYKQLIRLSSIIIVSLFSYIFIIFLPNNLFYLSSHIVCFTFIFLFSWMPFIWGINTSQKLSSSCFKGDILSNYFGITVPFLGFGLGLNISSFFAETLLSCLGIL